MPRVRHSKSVKREESERLKKLRKALGYTQRDLAKEFMVSNGSIALWENGDRTIPGAVLKLIEIYEKKTSKSS